MSFLNAMQPLQRNLVAQRFSDRRYEIIDAVLEASRSNSNIGITDQGENGKYRRLKVTRYFSDCDSVADDCNGNYCTPGEIQQPEQEYFDITRCIQSKVKSLRKEDLRTVDGNWTFADHAQEQIRSGMDELHRELARRIDALILANAGVHLDGNTTKRTTFTDNTNGVINPWGLWEIQQEFADGGFSKPYVVGSKEVFQWKKALGIATDNNTTGQNYRQLNSERMFYDTVLNEVAGDTANGEHVLAFDPNSLLFVSWNENAGIFATNNKSLNDFNNLYADGNGSYINGVLRDSYGLLWDLYVRFDECAFDNKGGWTWFIRLKWDIYFPRVQPCNAPGVNGIFHWRTCPVRIPDCPTGTVPPAPATQNIYQNTPGAIYPFTAYQVAIGNQIVYPSTPVANIDDLVALLNDSSGYNFYKSGSNIRVKGYSGITVNINNGEHTLAFTIPSPPIVE